MSTSQIQVQTKTKNKLEEVKRELRTKSYTTLFERLISLYKSQYKNPKQIALEELKENIDKYHYLFTPEEFNILGNINPILLASQQARVKMLRNMADQIENSIGQTQLEGGDM